MPDTCLPTTIVIFGASGDLTWRKLIPALYNNFKKGRLHECAHIVGFARRPFTNGSLCEKLKEGVKTFTPETFDEAVWERFSNMIYYFQGNLDAVGDYTRLDQFLVSLEGEAANRLYYLATAPEHYALSVQGLGRAGMAVQTNCWRRIIIEKPFGSDLETAQELNRTVHNVFEESQVYRIDHYLGKETAQNILYFRFANTIFEPVWNRRYVDNVQVTVAETVDVENRGSYYDQVGVVCDMFQNHLLQLLSLVAMEPPASFNADAVRNEKAKVLESIRPINLSDTVRGQYEGYCDVEGVTQGSQTPTYAAVKLYIDNWRWKDVPFYLRSGKALTQKTSTINIEFQRPPHLMFHLPEDSQFSPNLFSLCIQPDEGIHLRFEAKVPGAVQEMRSVDMDFHYRSSFGGWLPEAYERLLQDALQGDASLFTRSDAIETSWRLMDVVNKGWIREGVPDLVYYPRGSWGPNEAEALLGRDGRTWWQGCQDEEGTIHA
jgi:glucose-6-phosphate 1-dehydrogenase